MASKPSTARTRLVRPDAGKHPEEIEYRDHHRDHDGGIHVDVLAAPDVTGDLFGMHAGDATAQG
jgi:hypothetical protein